MRYKVRKEVIYGVAQEAEIGTGRKPKRAKKQLTEVQPLAAEVSLSQRVRCGHPHIAPQRLRTKMR